MSLKYCLMKIIEMQIQIQNCSLELERLQIRGTFLFSPQSAFFFRLKNDLPEKRYEYSSMYLAKEM